VRPLALLALVLAFAYQSLAMPFYRWGPAAPDFVLLVLGYLAFFERPRRALALAFAAGSLLDLLSLDPWGARALGWLPAVLLAAAAGSAAWSGDALPRALTAGAAAGVAEAARALILLAAEPEAVPGLGAIAGRAAWNGVLALVVFPLLDAVRGRLHSPRRAFT
jgi:rod shape-determining protein MreD